MKKLRNKVIKLNLLIDTLILNLHYTAFWPCWSQPQKHTAALAVAVELDVAAAAAAVAVATFE